jgi:non-ribosomal peptide synthetase component E (peptide arylation enzyme)
MSKPIRWTQEMIDEYVRKGYWNDTTLSDLWERNARDFPDREAIADPGQRLTWSEANKWINRLALGLLELGLKKDEVVVIQLPTGVEHGLMRVACEKAGLLALPALRNLRHTEMEHILGYSEAAAVAIPLETKGFNFYDMIKEIRPKLPKLRHVLVAGDTVPEGAVSIQNMVDRAIEKEYPPDYLKGKGMKATETSLILHTTGTTGAPKFVEYQACHRVWQWTQTSKHLKITGDDVFALITPHCGGVALPAFFGAPLVGAKVVALQSTDMEDAFKLIQKERVTVGCVVPTLLAMMAEHQRVGDYDLSSMRLWWCTGAPLPYEVGVKAEAKLGGTIVTLIGASDWGSESINLPENPPEIRFRTVGRPIDGTEIKLIDDDGKEGGPGEVGEILGKGPTGVSGYFRDPEATAEVWTEDGYYRTGDLGKFDEAGNLVVVGRKKDMIIRGGQNVYPIEIENVLLKHPAVLEVAVVGMPDPLMGQRACAYVVPRQGMGFTFDEMISFLREKKLAPFKLPERLEVVAEVPKVGGQKVDKKLLVAMITEKLKAEGKIQ